MVDIVVEPFPPFLQIICNGSLNTRNLKPNRQTLALRGHSKNRCIIVSLALPQRGHVSLSTRLQIFLSENLSMHTNPQKTSQLCRNFLRAQIHFHLEIGGESFETKLWADLIVKSPLLAKAQTGGTLHSCPFGSVFMMYPFFGLQNKVSHFGWMPVHMVTRMHFS